VTRIKGRTRDRISREKNGPGTARSGGQNGRAEQLDLS
jgi:hypothetical protein